MDAHETLLLHFLAWGLDNRDWSASTRRTYRRQVRAFRRWLTDTHRLTLRRATTIHVQDWLASLPSNPRTRNVARNALVAFYDYLAATTRRVDNPARAVPRPKARRILPSFLADDHAAKVYLEACHAGARWAAACSLLLFGGLRCGELLAARWDDLDQAGYLDVIGKGRHERRVALPDETLRRLEDWRAECPASPWMFPSPRIADRPMSATWLRSHLTAFGRAADIRVYPHLLRHTHATALLDSGADLATVRDQLGHVSIATTSIYLHSRPVRQREAVQRLKFA